MGARAPRLAELHLLEGETVIHVEPVGSGGLRLGRAAGNDLVLADPAVSGHHCSLSWNDGELVLVDLRSRNGTTAGGRPVTGPTPVGDGELVVLGGRVSLRVRVYAFPKAADTAYAIEIGPARFPLGRDRFRIGSAEHADLKLPDGPPVAAVVLLVGDEVRLATDDDDVELPPDEPFTVAGRQLVLRRVEAALAETVPLRRTTYRYELEADLASGPGPVAVLRDPDTGRSHRVEVENRAVLLWVLGRRFVEDEARTEPDRGWCADDDVLSAVWGREGASADPTRLRVLLCRLRKELQDAGLDGGCLEKRQGHLRIRLGSAALGS